MEDDASRSAKPATEEEFVPEKEYVDVAASGLAGEVGPVGTPLLAVAFVPAVLSGPAPAPVPVVVPVPAEASARVAQMQLLCSVSHSVARVLPLAPQSAGPSPHVVSHHHRRHHRACAPAIRSATSSTGPPAAALSAHSSAAGSPRATAARWRSVPAAPAAARLASWPQGR